MEMLVKSGELLSLRSAARNLYDAVTRLNSGEVEKYVLLDNKHDIKAIVLTPATYAQLVAAAECAPTARAA
jgi:hypothetical protein